jgi:hypothetical protein
MEPTSNRSTPLVTIRDVTAANVTMMANTTARRETSMTAPHPSERTIMRIVAEPRPDEAFSSGSS